ncbi:undecaprenyldiphospho-muramoylpentapeptide beta-N-acetylglucosaminyltransferase [Inhella gelatinilytica]|uniref:UDP-N-acetylglucosamine--N-acetylmuramyl-(pentapeptide) pyrophosphoryl-undecaprenol N-acetylglucosamine transferase n=1 Tax=Inhella gelatinilytica TaxID=2795030 RepID=A0A931IYW7_9BURK|nr:undecaprenyldiphospho-muramoylpentapeptide beta-N-acetylglucosaminyltransferase [Inhella gelatinilytica]MBH9552361.1 undecaprenyldiphospho-muramoylpentapeptide beta-N-acetylglucosaminyltransferase [Inhella gelatinilytica]
MSERHLVIMAAGTGGHVIPGLALAAEMKRRGWSISWLGTAHGMENQLVPKAGIELDTLRFSGLRGKNFIETVFGGLRLLKAFWDCLGILRRRRATAVLGMGGYVCFPGGLMAALLGKPLVLVNADAGLLLSNKALLPVADRVAFGFGFQGVEKIQQGVVTGNPVRAAIENLPAPAERFADRSGPLRVLVVGGSLGAKALNEAIPAALALLKPEQRPQLVHQTGNANLAAVLADYDERGLHAEVRPFIDDMAAELAAADLVICRAGAITMSELCAAGVAAVLVPLVVKTTAHQRDNARHLAAQGAALHLPQAEATPERLAALLSNELSRERCLALAEAARAQHRPGAAQRVADAIEALNSGVRA